MQVSEIKFCNSMGHNLKNDREKSDILDILINDYNINFNDNSLIYSDKILNFILKYEHLVSTITNGNKYWLYLTKFKNTNYSILIDKKIQKGHRFPKMVIVNYRFDNKLYSDTLFSGELIKDNNNNWHFLLENIVVHQGKKINKKSLIDRIKLIYTILNNSFINDDNLQICTIGVKRLFTYDQLDNMIDNFIKNCSYKILGISFIPISSMDRNINFLFRKTNNDTRQLNIELLNTNNSLKESKNDAKKLLKNAKDIIIHSNSNSNSNSDSCDLLLNMLKNELYDDYCDDEIFTFIINKSKFHNIFLLFIKKGLKKYIKHSIARIDTIECAEMVNGLLKNNNSNDIFVDCIFCIKFKKWIPINKSKFKKTCSLSSLEKYLKK